MKPGELIRRVRQAEGLTQTALARRLGVTQPSVARLEAVGDEASVATLQRALAALGHKLELHTSRLPSSVDETLIAENLHLSPGQRIERHDREYVNMRALALEMQASLERVA